jgi:hypothetical protein
MSIKDGDTYTVRIGNNTYEATLKSYIDPNDRYNKIWWAVINTADDIIDEYWEKVNDQSYEQHLTSQGKNLQKLQALLHRRGFIKGRKRARSATRFRSRSSNRNNGTRRR